MVFLFVVLRNRINLRPTEKSQVKSHTAREGADSEAGFAKQSTDRSPQFY